MKNKNNFKFFDEKGVIELPAIIIFSLVIVVIGLSLLGGSFIINLISNIFTQQQESFYLSDSGIQDGLLRIARNKNFTDTDGYDPNIADSGETLSVKVFGITEKTIESSANIKNKHKEAKATISIDSDGKITFSSWKELTSLTTDILGKSCSDDSECDSNHCADGYCCDASCVGDCRACDISGHIGTCTYVAAGQEGENCTTACKECNGAGFCVDIANNIQDNAGSNTCNETCHACDGDGNCDHMTVYGSSATSLGCTQGEEACRLCDSGECTSYDDHVQHYCSTCYACDTGSCTAMTVDGSSATSLGCTAGDEGCRRCNAGNCTYYTSDQNSCSACNTCDYSGKCISVNSAWGAGLYGCSAGSGNAANRCYNGSCRSCSTGGGQMFSWAAASWGTCSSCSDIDTEGGNICWRWGDVDQSCTSKCLSYGGTLPGDWQETTGCPFCLATYPTYTCAFSCGAEQKYFPSTLPYGPLFLCCSNRTWNTSDEEPPYSGYQRMCVCQY